MTFEKPARHRQAAEEADRAGEVCNEFRRVWQLFLRLDTIMRGAKKRDLR